MTVRPTAGSLQQRIRTQQQLLAEGQPDRFGGVEIDDELERRRLLHRQVFRVGASQNPVDVGRSPIELFREVGAVAHQSADLNGFAGREQRRQTLLDLLSQLLIFCRSARRLDEGRKDVLASYDLNCLDSLRAHCW